MRNVIIICAGGIGHSLTMAYVKAIAELGNHVAVVSAESNFQEVVDIQEQAMAERKSILESKLSLKAIQYELQPVVKEYFIDNPRRKQKRRRARKY